MATFKIKLEDKAAFLNRMEKQGETISSEQIKDNKLEDYFEVDIINPKQLEVAKVILKKSPKINTIKEMKKKLTKDQLKEMIRQELSGVIAEKKKMKDVDKKQKLDEMSLGGIDLNQLLNMTDHELGVFIAGVSTILGVGGLLGGAFIKDFRNKIKSGEIKSKEDVIDAVENK
jgi:hypothetical protein